ncbi:FG-GAP-like repeat-containing protein [Nodularia sphaerocarpa]|uniref:FG-GAP-like repeat-containing protein n=1 Tax=Nodularia sphaerocarpa TaxID=137816 RepID=UPI001EFBECF4|nr:FG-GAP-like repeat-containing protein [Nodularia sphaerocarpa]MDB9374645.1 FG-GAP-like repeat-containing protein [Nodularia sphaerocarpa CS-585]MDB9379691.1 FG-GAP-like repeat-containing protein [Nodularia sphaerocarpa CS-585A2]ULP74879.1 Electron transport complex subunit RsxD [Nodularia sphaerocarpa UHCC 0038]
MTTSTIKIENSPFQWERKPSLSDPRLAILGILISYIILGITVLGFNRSPAQILLIITAACGFDMILHWLFKQRQLLFPLSAAITGCSLSILTNFAHASWLPLVPVFFAISSKYLFTANNRHIYNPALFGITASLLLGNGLISAAPAYQWGGSIAIVIFIITAALLLFALRINRTALIISFLGFYTIQLCIRAYLMHDLIPAETIVMGALSSPAFYLFTFFMITDPATSPQTKKGQIWMSLIIVLLDLYLHKFESLSTFFFAGFIYFSGRLLWFKIQEIKDLKQVNITQIFNPIYRWSLIACIGTSGFWGYQQLVAAKDIITTDFTFEEIAADAAGISTHKSEILEQIDPRLQHIGKWLLSVGDAVALADVNQDGLQDIFLTYPLKDNSDRAALYLNQGNFKFTRLPIPALEELVNHQTTAGLPSGALWWDYDNDSDADLFLSVGYGKSRLLQNRFREECSSNEKDCLPKFIDVSAELGIDDYTISLTANAVDMNRDGKLDLMVGNAMNPLLPGYEKPTYFNIFQLPQPEYDNDRRMMNVMHRTWYDADNGGENLFYLNTGKKLEKQDVKALGLDGNRWTLDIGTGDLNGDGWTDLYLANDFGPDQLYINQQGKKFDLIRGKLVGKISHDTYKGMNASLGDIDNNGQLDIYVSNVHEKLQAEGSLLWMNSGNVDQIGEKAFTDAAMKHNILNENRFGWGGAMGDLDRDGKLDILQANGMVDNSYDRPLPETRNQRLKGKITTPHYFQNVAAERKCADFWYWNSQIALTGPDIHGYADRWADLRDRCIFPYEQNRVYLNEGKRFLDVASQVGWNELGNSRGIALTDLDNDGDLDALVTHQFQPVSIYRNVSAPKSWLGLDLAGNGKSCNRDAVGTQVIINSHGDKQLREVQASNGFSAQGDKRLLFGLGSYEEELIPVEIHWCGDENIQHQHLQVNQYHHLLLE